MKNFSLLLISATILLRACSTSTDVSNNFQILPHPQEIEFSGFSKISPDEVPDFGTSMESATEVVMADNNTTLFKEAGAPELKDEAYILEITAKEILISAKDERGLFYAVKTLQQIQQDAAEQELKLPKCKINDEPKLSYRAIHLDIKHHLEKVEYYYGLINWLASYKVNAIIAEVEDKIEYKRQPVVGSPDAISIDDWIKLSNYAKERNIEISPLVQGLGHASFILKHDQYKSLRDNPDSDWAFNPLDEETYKVQFDLYLDAMEALPHGKYLHVGGDEVHTTGRNSGKSNLELQLIWLNKVCQFAEEHNRIPIFWDDMPLKHAGVYRPMFNNNMTQAQVDSIWNKNGHKLEEFLDQFPKNCIYMRWNYQSPETYGNTKAMEWFRQNGLPVMGATAGQTRWVLMPQNQSNMESIKNFALSSIETGLDGLLLTLWDDDSPHFELYKRGITFFAEYSWAGDQRSNEDVKSAYRQREFSFEASTEGWGFIDELEQPVAFWKNALLKRKQRNSLISQKDPMNESIIDLPDLNNPGIWAEKNADRVKRAEEVFQTCELVREKIENIKATDPNNKYTLSIYEQVNQLTQFTAGALLNLNRLSQVTDRTEQLDILNKLKRLNQEFESLRENFESAYGQSRVLQKPSDYILDQDHHHHSANQSLNFDWQFIAEILFLEKLDNWLK